MIKTLLIILSVLWIGGCTTPTPFKLIQIGMTTLYNSNNKYIQSNECEFNEVKSDMEIRSDIYKIISIDRSIPAHESMIISDLVFEKYRGNYDQFNEILRRLCDDKN